MLRRVGSTARNAFFESMPGFRDLLQKLENRVRRHGWLPGLDGRRVPVRSLHVALNYIIVASEAIICKRWLAQVHDELRARFRYGWDGDVVLVLWVHDELVACCKPEIADAVSEIMTRHGREAGEFYGFRVPLKVDCTVGSGWAEPPEQAEASERQDADAEPAEQQDTSAQAKAEPPPDDPIDDDPVDDDPVDDGPTDDASANDAPIDDDPPPDDDPVDDDPVDDDTPSGGSDTPGDDSDDDFEDDEPDNGKAAKPDRPFSDEALKRRGYKEVVAFGFKMPDGVELYQKIRYEHPPLPKTFRVCREVNGVWLEGAGPRHIRYNWLQLLCAPPGSNIYVVEGEGKVDALAKAGLLATTTAFHEWTRDSINALAGHHVLVLADHDKKGIKYAEAAQAALAPVAASVRLVRYKHLWRHLPADKRGDKPRPHEDIKNWLEERGGDPARLLDICRKIPADGIIAASYQFQDEAKIPRWEFLYGLHLLRGEVSGTAAMGGTGKSTKSIVEALAMASGRPLDGQQVPAVPLRVILGNLEDTRNTVDKRIAAVMRHYGLKPEDIGDRLIVIAKGEVKIKVARQKRSGDVERNQATINALIKLARKHRADVISIDSFIRTHAVNENDNSAIQEVVECFEDIAVAANCAVHLWHHTRKAGGGEVTIEAARGASAFIDACRSARIMQTMTAKEYESILKAQPTLKLQPPGFYFRAFNGKRNFAPPADVSDWYEIKSKTLANGDNVGVVTVWAYPAIKTDIPPEITDRILTDIGRGLDNGQRYSNDNAATKRAAWKVVQKYCPDKKPKECKRVITDWLKQDLLYEDEYDNPLRNEKQTGLYVREIRSDEI
jgi:hypothetical protein